MSFGDANDKFKCVNEPVDWSWILCAGVAMFVVWWIEVKSHLRCLKTDSGAGWLQAGPCATSAELVPMGPLHHRNDISTSRTSVGALEV
jgi:hypothetical protein